MTSMSSLTSLLFYVKDLRSRALLSNKLPSSSMEPSKKV
jgi:hypothetical protein